MCLRLLPFIKSILVVILVMIGIKIMITIFIFNVVNVVNVVNVIGVVNNFNVNCPVCSLLCPRSRSQHQLPLLFTPKISIHVDKVEQLHHLGLFGLDIFLKQPLQERLSPLRTLPPLLSDPP